MTSDPARYVDQLSELVESWVKWYNEWHELSREGRAVPGDHFFLPASDMLDKFFREAKEIMEAQARVNVMLLAAIDQLEKRISDREYR